MNDFDPEWELKLTETVCTQCWLVQPCDCGEY